MDDKIIPIPVNLPEGFDNMQLAEGFGEPQQLFNMRGWLEKACEAQGAKVMGGGIGMGSADIDIELEGHGYYLTIKPTLR